MPNIPRDERRVNRAQALYDKGVDRYLDMIENIDKDIVNICDLLHGFALGKEDEKYQLSNSQYTALKDQLNTWKANVQNPDKVLAYLNEGLKKERSNKQEPKNSSSGPAIARFSSKASG